MKLGLLVITLFVSVCSFGQSDPKWLPWNQPVEPFRVIGNVYYVGAKEISSFLITSSQGHILLDGGMVETAPLIRDNIRKLGFKVEDVKYLLNSHAHGDHAGGLAQLKQWTGAQFIASREDAAQIARGGHDDFAWGDKYTFPPVKADRAIADGKQVSIGDAIMTAHLTPGHTKGCTTWSSDVEEKGHRYHVLFVCSITAPGYKLVHNTAYPNIVEDYRKTFTYLKSLPCDVLLASHGSAFGLEDKLAAWKAYPGQNPFIDPKGCHDFIEESQHDFEAELKKQQSSAP